MTTLVEERTIVFLSLDSSYNEDSHVVLTNPLQVRRLLFMKCYLYMQYVYTLLALPMYRRQLALFHHFWAAKGSYFLSTIYKIDTPMFEKHNLWCSDIIGFNVM